MGPSELVALFCFSRINPLMPNLRSKVAIPLANSSLAVAYSTYKDSFLGLDESMRIQASPSKRPDKNSHTTASGALKITEGTFLVEECPPRRISNVVSCKLQRM